MSVSGGPSSTTPPSREEQAEPVDPATAECDPIDPHDPDAAGPVPDEDVEGFVDGDPTPIIDEPIWTRRDWWACALIVIASALLIGMHVRAYPTMSPIDELQHLDYVIRAGEFDIPQRNERVGFEAMSEVACRSVDAPNYVGPPCGLDEYDPETFQERGFNTAASQFPPYYVVTGVPTRLLVDVGVVGSHVTAARLMGIVWFAAAWCVTWYLLALARVRLAHRAVVIAALMATPLTLFHAGATINADVSLMLAGALAVLTTVKYVAGRMPWWSIPLIFTGLFFIESTVLLALAVCAAFLSVRAIVRADLPWTNRLAPLALFPWLAALRLEIAPWLQNQLFPAVVVASRRERMSSAPMFELNDADGVSIDKVLAQLPATFTPVGNTYLSTPLNSSWTISALQLLNWTLIGLLFAGAVVLVVRRGEALWARLTALALLAAGPFYTFYYAYFSGSDFAAPGRFALPLVPLLAVVAATAIRNRATFAVVSAVMSLTVVTTVVQLVSAQ